MNEKTVFYGRFFLFFYFLLLPIISVRRWRAHSLEVTLLISRLFTRRNGEYIYAAHFSFIFLFIIFYFIFIVLGMLNCRFFLLFAFRAS